MRRPLLAWILFTAPILVIGALMSLMKANGGNYVRVWFRGED